MLKELPSLINALGQYSLLVGVEQLTPLQQENFCAQLKMFAPLLKEQKRLLTAHSTHSTPLPFSSAEPPQDFALGEALVAQGKVGCLILAGGQGTRLGFAGPKGMVPVSCVRHKSLFQHLAERVNAAAHWANKEIPVAIMTSPVNHGETTAFFKKNAFFGLRPSFFEQKELPFIDEQGDWLLERPGELAMGPDGNGHALQLFFSTGIWHKWKEKGIEYVNLIFVDNALADPIDRELVGFVKRSGFDAALKAIKRVSPTEMMGVLAQKEGKLCVVEYSEIPPYAPEFTLSSTGMFCVSMDFIHFLCHELKAEFPLHLAKKTALIANETKRVGKCERFLFDLLNYTRSSGALLVPREKHYAPLKNAEGDKSLKTVQEALLSYDQERYFFLTGKRANSLLFELSPAFYYPSESLKKKLRDHPLQEGEYVDL